MAATYTTLPENLQDEIWMIMHRVAEFGVHPEDTLSSEDDSCFECEEYIDEVIEVDSPYKREDLKDVAGKLKKAADALDEEEKLVQDIVAYIRSMGDKINE